MLKKIIVIGVLILIAAAFIPTVKSHLKGGSKVIVDSINKNTPASYDEARISTLLDEEKVQIGSFKTEILEIQSRTATDKQKIERLKVAVAEEKESLKKAGDLILENKEEYIINGEPFTLIDIEVDAEARMDGIEKMEEQIAFLTEITNSLDQTAKSCKANLAKAMKSHATKKGDLEKLKARKVNAEIKQRVWQLSTRMNGISDDLSSQTELQKAMTNYENKVTILENKSDDGVSKTRTLIDYSSPETDKKTTTEKIAEVLN